MTLTMYLLPLVAAFRCHVSLCPCAPGARIEYNLVMCMHTQFFWAAHTDTPFYEIVTNNHCCAQTIEYNYGCSGILVPSSSASYQFFFILVFFCWWRPVLIMLWSSLCIQQQLPSYDGISLMEIGFNILLKSLHTGCLGSLSCFICWIKWSWLLIQNTYTLDMIVSS